MKLISKTKIILPSDGKDVKSFLTFNDKSVAFQISKLKQNFRFSNGDPEKFKERMEQLKAEQNKCLLFYDVEGNPWTYSGLWKDLQNRFKWELEVVGTADQKRTPVPYKETPPEMREYQKECVQTIVSSDLGGVNQCAIELPTGCHAADTLILMFDGSLKKVQDIKINDLLMGPDSQERKVIGLHTGRQTMAKITPIKGDSFVVNLDHILSLKRTTTKSNYNEIKKRRKDFMGSNPIVNISVRDYLEKSKTFKHTHKLYRVGVDFQQTTNTFDIPPYILGAWLGDGDSSHPGLTSMDSEISSEWIEWIKLEGMEINISAKENNKAKTFNAVIPKPQRSGFLKGTGISKNKCKLKLDQMNVTNNKHIPFSYKTASRADRLELLAGLIDTDGHHASGYYDYITKLKVLADDIAFLARSLGFCVVITKVKKGCQTGYVGEYYRISIMGDISCVPVRLERKKAKPRTQIKDVLNCGFSVEILPEDDYYGFEVDSDNLYLMGDFTVTHNSGKSLVILNLLKHYGVKTLIVTPFSNITGQLCKDLEKYFGTKYVGQFGDGKKKTDKLFTVATAQSVTRVVKGSKEWTDLTECKMIIFDEAHFVATETFKSICLEGVAEHYPYRFFLSATQTRTDGSELLLRGVTGPVVYRKSFKELAGTFLKTVNVKFFNVPVGSPPQNDPKRETRNQIYNNPHVAKLAATLAEKAWLAAGRQTVILIEEYEQFVLLKNYLGAVPYGFAHGTVSALAKETLPEQYWKCDVDAIVKQFNDGSLPILIGTTAVATGVDIRPTGCLIYLQGGISEIKVKQGVGRGTRPVAHPDLWVVDFNVQGSPTMERHARARAEVYSTLTDSEIRFIG